MNEAIALDKHARRAASRGSASARLSVPGMGNDHSAGIVSASPKRLRGTSPGFCRNTSNFRIANGGKSPSALGGYALADRGFFTEKKKVALAASGSAIRDWSMPVEKPIKQRFKQGREISTKLLRGHKQGNESLYRVYCGDTGGDAVTTPLGLSGCSCDSNSGLF